ncbi:MAG: ferrous iron transport protein A [Candidatus Aminicenantes bacterium]|nr:ferrous iron transport protein A [Candidatus Aminicenantes bacterium]
MNELDLEYAPANVELQVLRINAGRIAARRLMAMGVRSEDKIIKLNDSSWGPVLVKNVTLNSTKIAIGRRLAHKILVRYEET